GAARRPASAARRRRAPLRRADGRRPRRGPHLRPRHDAAGGGELPGPRARPGTVFPEGRMSDDPRLGVTVTQRRYVPYAHAHYAGNLVDGAYALALFGDVATEVCIRTDGDEGLFAGYSEVRFTAPIRAGDVLVCSSAGGGLRLAVVGYEALVSAEAGHRVALSAGARVVHVAAGRLAGPDVAALRASRPDVVLLVGGTDGGDADVLTHNARRLAAARLRVPVVVAGNADARDEVLDALRAARVPVVA